MRKVFSSIRLENVEAVAELLRAEGIEVKISDGRSYRGSRRSNFSYRDNEQSGAQPTVWILNADDQPRGRQLLRPRPRGAVGTLVHHAEMQARRVSRGRQRAGHEGFADSGWSADDEASANADPQ